MLADEIRALVALEGRGKDLGSTRGAGGHQNLNRQIDCTIARSCGDRFSVRHFRRRVLIFIFGLVAGFLAIFLGFTSALHSQGAGLHEQPCRRDAVLERPFRGMPHIDDERLGSGLREVRNLFLELLDNPFAEAGDAHVPDFRRGRLARDNRRGRLFADKGDLVRNGGISADHRQRHLGTWLTPQQPHALDYGQVARRFAVDAADVVAGLKSGFCSGRAVARGDHSKIVLAGQLETDVAVRQRRSRLHFSHLLRVQVGAVRIEAFREPLQRAFHGAVDLDLLDIVAEYQLQHIVEHAKMLEGLVASGRRRAANQPADNDEDHDRG